MAKNKTMRVAAFMLALTLITSCFVGGTFAKYVTSADANASARVAKWGVTAEVTGGAFADEYAIEDADSALDVAVKADVNVVAPGTSGEFGGVALTGTPEVAVRVTKTATVAVEGWAIEGDDFYCPIVVDINGYQIDGNYATDAADFANQIKEAIEDANGEYAPGTDLSTVENLNGNYSWSWSFEANESTDGSDEKDTALGNLETAPTISLSVEVLVEQID